MIVGLCGCPQPAGGEPWAEASCRRPFRAERKEGNPTPPRHQPCPAMGPAAGLARPPRQVLLPLREERRAGSAEPPPACPVAATRGPSQVPERAGGRGGLRILSFPFPVRLPRRPVGGRVGMVRRRHRGGRGLWGARGGGGRGAALAVLLGLLAALGLLLLWQRAGPQDRQPEPGQAAAGGAPLPPSLPAAGGLRRPVYEKPPLGSAGELGELGRAARLELGEAERLQQEESVRRHQINIYLSDRISLHRRLPERRHPQ